MDECKDTWYPFSWYCPNCGTQLIGFKNAEGMIKVECKRCLAVSVRKVMGRRHNRIDVYAPKGQETVKIDTTLLGRRSGFPEGRDRNWRLQVR